MTATGMVNRVAAFVAVVVALLVGLFAFGRISDDENVAMGLTAVWFGVVFLVAAAVALRRRTLLVPLAVGYGAVAIAAAIFVVAPTLFDKEVNERVVTGAPASAAPAADRPEGNVQLAAGSFVPNAHDGRGSAAVVELPGGDRKLTLTDFQTDSGPDLRVYVSTEDPAESGLGDFEDLGALKGNVGNQQYDLPRGIDLDRYSTVVVWCRAFSVAFTSAGLEPS